MRDTERRIKEYQTKLPHLRAKVASVALFLMISILMMSSATFAWLTVSRSPEITGIETTVAANGNLEIALSDESGEQPLESGVGDSLLALVDRNKTWGNLVNLSATEYGLSEIELRPAVLNTSMLLSRPLYAASYGADGRVQALVSDFAYANYDQETDTFRISDNTKYGVRAISSVTYTFAGGAQVFQERLNKARISYGQAVDEYDAISKKKADGTNNDNMLAIASILSMYLDDKFNDTNSNYKNSLPVIQRLMEEFSQCMETTGQAILYTANLQMMLAYGDTKTAFGTIDELLAVSESKLKSEYGISIQGLQTYKTDRNTLALYLKEIKGYNEDVTLTEIYWDDIKHIVNFLVDIDSTEVAGVPVSNINSGNMISVGMQFLGNPVAIIKKGALYNMELRLATYMNVTDLVVTMPIMGGVDVSVTVRTNAVDATEKEFLKTALSSVESSDNSNFVGTDPVAADTYGIAIDFWVRSNAKDDYLVLEGNTIVESRHKQDSDGYYYYADKDTGAVVIKKTNGKYYDEYGNEVSGNNLVEIYEDVVVGYEGANRVWDDAALSKNSTTQGNGSCYIFYADSPQDQQQSLEILKAMSVVFIDEDGNLLAYADMDTESCYALNGRVTVPLKLRNDSIIIGEDEDEIPMYGITQLEQGKAQRITALLYINGTKIQNSEVLAASNIQGQLNLQFGSSVDMETIDDENIKYDEIHITGTADPTYLVYSSTEELKSNVTLNISGVTPTTVTANFIRSINSTQGTRQETIEFKPNTSGQYVANVEFESPGNYVLRTVWVDGVEYMLDSEIEIEIEGFAINRVAWKNANYSNYVKIMTSEISLKEDLIVEFSGSGVDITKVQGVFENTADNQWITVDFAADSTLVWSGSTQFTSSGVYTMKYLLVNGEYYEIPADKQKTMDLTLGMSGQIVVEDAEYVYDGEKTLPISAKILSDKGEEIKALQNVKLQYRLQGSLLDEGGLFAELTWNATTEKYEGNFQVKLPGAYAFAYIKVGDNIVTSAEATIVQAIPPEPPVFYEGESEEYVYSAEQDVTMGVSVTNSQAVTSVTAIMEKEGKTISVLGTKGVTDKTTDGEPLTHWTFKLPTDEELTALNAGTKQSGTWTIKQLSIAGTYKDGKLYTIDNPLVMEVSGEGLTTLVANNMAVEFENAGKTKEFDVEFLTECTVSDMAVTITDEHGTVFDITNVNLTYALDNVIYSDTAGFSDDEATQNVVENMKSISIGMSRDANNPTKYKTDSSIILQLVGTYNLDQLTFEIEGQKYTTKASSTEANVKKVSTAGVAPRYTINWTTPDVKITGITPTEGKAITVCTKRAILSWNYEYGTFTPEISDDQYSCKTAKEAKSAWFGADYIGENSSVTLTADKLGKNFTEATMFFDGKDLDVTYVFKPDDLDIKQTVGSTNSNIPSLLGPAVSVSTLTVTNEDVGIIYNFTVHSVSIECQY